MIWRTDLPFRRYDQCTDTGLPENDLPNVFIGVVLRYYSTYPHQIWWSHKETIDD